MYRCVECGEVFDEPLVNVRREYLGDFLGAIREEVCPYCGGAVEEVEECEYCAGYKRKGMDMCDACHENLMSDVAGFFGQYDATEMAAIEQQLDGVHIGDFMQRYGKGN